MTRSFDRRHLDGVYFLQYKRLLSPRSAADRNTAFATVGTGGYFFHSRIGERHQPRPDGSVVVFPARTHAKLSSTRMATFSVGLEHRLNERTRGQDRRRRPGPARPERLHRIPAARRRLDADRRLPCALIERTARVIIAVACIATLGCEQRSGGDPWVIAGPTVPDVVAARAICLGHARGTDGVDRQRRDAGAIPDRHQRLQWRNRHRFRGWTITCCCEAPISTLRCSACARCAFATCGPHPASGPLERSTSGSTRPTRRVPISNSAGLPTCGRHQHGRRPSFACRRMPPLYTPLDVNYVYFEGDSASDTEGLLKIDSIALMTE